MEKPDKGISTDTPLNLSHAFNPAAFGLGPVILGQRILKTFNQVAHTDIKHIATDLAATLFPGTRAEDIATKADSTRRGLTAGEKKMAHALFGDKINTDEINVFDRQYFDAERSGYTTPNGDIYCGTGHYSKDFSLESTDRKAVFVHELTHAFQYQSGEHVKLNAMTLGIKSGFDDYEKNYKYDLNKTKDFSALNIEQQGDVFENFYRNYEKYKGTPSIENAKKLQPYAKLLGPEFPSVNALLNEAGYKEPPIAQPLAPRICGP